MAEFKTGDKCKILDIKIDDNHYDEKEELVGKRITIRKHRFTWRDGYSACEAIVGDKIMIFHSVKLEKINQSSF